MLVEAFRAVVKSHPETVLLVAGDGALRGLVEERIRQFGLNGNVRLLGFREDVPELLKMADIFALSSLWEGMGRAMTEAMLLGKPVVVPRVNGIPEIVRDGETGLLYEPGRTDQLAACLLRLLEHPQQGEHLGANARRLTRRHFDLNHMVREIEAIYDQLSLGAVPGSACFTLPPNGNITPLVVEEERLSA
ncbi:MAG: hypothetical protein AUI36_07965 [Cyanobacteria bacterium 13_1_40CM_2_61_4]|nr:MAG: hypothetical protein AUI36_07965 [Cyanobacteria bacterium 13_1_40CM_2_61_4]